MPSKRVSLKGKGADLFFGDYTPESPLADDGPPPAAPSAPALDPTKALDGLTAKLPRKRPTRAQPNGSNSVAELESNHASKLASTQSSNILESTASDQASALAIDGSEPDDRADPHLSPAVSPPEPASELSTRGREHISDVEAVRRIVKNPGREVSFIRLTPEEKAQVVDIVYAYKRKGQKTSETEIYRIALNFLLNDFHLHDTESLLARTLAALSA